MLQIDNIVINSWFWIDSRPVETGIVKEMTDDDKLIELVSIQNFDGSFKMESVLGQLLDTTLDDIREGI